MLMKKFSLTLLALLGGLFTTQLSAQTILDEDFETASTDTYSTQVARGEGWTTVNSYKGSKAQYNWHNYYHNPESEGGSTINGAHVAACDGPITGTEGNGPREEILLTPELTLDDTYQLQFSWIVSPMNAYDNSRYDLQVRVVENEDLASAETVFSIQSEQMLRESGVLTFPITTWDVHTSKVDLSDWKGTKVKLAFVYKMYTDVANVVWLDDVKVSKFTPATGPVAQVSLDRYDFKELYIGEKRYSDVITLTNTGKDGLKITSMELPQGVGINIDPEAVNLRAYEHVDFQLSYTASMTAPAKGEAVIHTTGGDIVISYQASKQLVPEGMMLETFEGYFPPAGWRNNGFGWSNSAIEGDRSVYCSGSYGACYLRSPRLDLSDGGKVTFTFYDQFEEDDGPYDDIELQVSYDNGESWTVKWTRDWQNEVNQLLTVTVDLGRGTDESYVRWVYPQIEMTDEGADPHSNFWLDRVLLPNVYGVGGVPGNVTMLAPKNNAEDVYPRDIVLEWGPAQFADGYKLYVGTSSACNEVIDGLDLGDALTYTIPSLDYETTYRWRVVGYNEVGNASSPSTWRFTTQPDMSVVEFPYEETFDECKDDIPTGWLTTTDAEYTFPKWSPNSMYAYKGTCLFTGWMNAGKSSTLLSPMFNLPNGDNMYISFYWGDSHPSDLLKDETGLLKKQNVEGGNGYSDVVFEIFADGEWHQESYLSENYVDNNEHKYWRYEKIDLTKYAGKKVQFRWINHSYGSKHDAAALDEIYMDGIVSQGVTFNKESWDAGRINYGKSMNSGNLLTYSNNGKDELKVKNVTFTTPNFESSIQPGDMLLPGEGTTFSIQFNAGDASAVVNDQMAIEFESGYVATFPVSGEALPQDVLFYGFEKNPLDYVWDEDFTTKDVDGQVNYRSNYYLTTIENDGGRYAFTLAEHNNPNLMAHTGNYTLAACAPDNNSAANDWLISKQIRPSADATFDFYARNLATTGSVFVGDNDLHSVTVLVSEKGNTDTNDFTVVMRETEMAYLPEGEWHHFEIDLSPYAGKDIYVAVRHTTVSANWLAFFDDFTFKGISLPGETGIDDVLRQMGDDAEVEVYSVNGVQLSNGRGQAAMQQLDRGLYIIKVRENGQTRNYTVVRR